MKLTLKHAVAAVILLLNLAVTVTAGQFEDAGAAFSRRDYATALRLFRPLAEQRDARAQSMLGLLYDGGLGVSQDFTEAAKWYFKAAHQGQIVAQFMLGKMYYGG